MATNNGAVRVGAGMPGGIMTSPLGTTAPTTPTASYVSAWVDAGLIDESGITESADVSTNDVRARDGSLVRRVKSSETVTIHFIAIERNGVTSDLFYPGSTRTTTGGVTTISKRTRITQPRAFAIDQLDNGLHTRTIIPKGEIGEFGDVVYQDSDVTKYEMTMVCYPDSSGQWALEYTDDANVATPAQPL